MERCTSANRADVRRVGADGLITTVAGKAVGNFSSDPDTFPLDVFGRPDTNPVRATDMAFSDKISDIAVGRAGELYISTAQTVFIVQVTCWQSSDHELREERPSEGC
jgi:hypothetical protein